MRYDKNHDFKLTVEELVTFIMDRTPPGVLRPKPEEVDELVGDAMSKFDKNKDSALQFEEFSEAYNHLMAGMNELLAKQRKVVMETTGFKGLMKRHDSTEALQEATKDRYKGPVWVIPYKETRTAIAEAYKAEKVPLLLDKPPGEFDLATSELESAGELLVQMQELTMEFAKNKLTAKEVAEKVREKVLDGMHAGRKVVLRMGQSTPDWMLSFNLSGVLPLEFLQHHAAGPLDAEFAKEFGVDPATRVVEGFQLVLTSCFTMDTYQQYFKAKLPLREVQPIQVMQTLEEVSAVLADGLPKDEMDDALAELDRLADLL